MKLFRKCRQTKGQMARYLVCFCVQCLTATLIWAAGIKTVGVILDRTVEIGEVLSFAGAAFGGELLMLLCKRMLAKNGKTEDESAAQ